MPRQFNVGSGSILLDVFSYEVKTLYSKKAVHRQKMEIFRFVLQKLLSKV